MGSTDGGKSIAELDDSGKVFAVSGNVASAIAFGQIIDRTLKHRVSFQTQKKIRIQCRTYVAASGKAVTSGGVSNNPVKGKAASAKRNTRRKQKVHT